MKQKLIAALVTSAIAGLAATSAQAGVIQASYKNFAAEAFGADVTLTAPVIAYNVSRPLSGTPSNPNQFTVTLTLTDGVWNSVPTVVLKDPSSGNPLMATSVVGASTNKLTATFVVNGGVTYPVNSTITFGDSDGVVAAVAATVKGVSNKLKTPLTTATACASGDPAQIGATIKLINNAGVEFDTIDAGSQVTTPILQSNVALTVTAVSSTSSDYEVAAPHRTESSRVDVLNPSLGQLFTNPVSASEATNSTTTIVLGRVLVKDRADLYDVGGLQKYSVQNADQLAPPVGAGDWGDNASGTGGVSADALALVVTGKFAEGGVVKLVPNADGTGVAYDTATVDVAAGTASFGGTGGASAWALNANNEREAFIAYTVPGNKLVPTASFVAASGSLTKVSGTNELPNPICAAPLYTLASNGVQLDVRNYIHKAQQEATGWQSVLRVINTDENQTVDVNAQIIDSDGHPIANGKILTLAPRAAKYISSADIESQLSGTFPAADGNNARLRITAAGSSIRVQNYHVNPATGTVTEVSSAQGDEGFIDAVGPAHNVYTKK